MDKYNDKVIPTLDDVISIGDPEMSILGDINALEDDFDDDFDDTSLRLDSSESDNLNDDSFENKFDNIALDNDFDDEQDSSGLDEITVEALGSEIEADISPSTDSKDFDQSIIDKIVAERFPPEKGVQPEETPAPAVDEIPAIDQDQLTSNDDDAEPVEAQPTEQPAPVATLSPDAEPAIKNQILISEIVDDITRQLLPEIEWKIRTRVRDILEQHFPDKD